MSRAPDLNAGGKTPRGPHMSSDSEVSTHERATSKKRTLSSGSSASNESVAPPVVHEPTTPPQSRPVIRQGLAFPSVTDKTVNTYEPASGSSAVKAFLPGQEVQGSSGAVMIPIATASSSNPSTSLATPAPTLAPEPGPTPIPNPTPEKPTTTRGTKKSTRGSGNKRMKHEDAAFSTGRFRLSQYSSRPTEIKQFSQGSYTWTPISTVVAPAQQRVSSFPSPSPGPASGAPVSSPFPNVRSAMSEPSSIAKMSSKTSKQPTALSSPAHIRQDTPPSLSAQKRTIPPLRIPSTSQMLPPLSISSPANTAHAGVTSSPPSDPGGRSLSASYYRHNYEQERLPSRPNPARQILPSTPTHTIETISLMPPPGVSSSKGKERETPRPEPEPGKTKGLRMVTVLIEDQRTDPPDHQLAEIRIPLKVGNRENERWCDALDLSQALQATASRIDGPAKVFTRRGDYRQYFLRVTQDQMDHCTSMNIPVSSERTVQIFVEQYNLPMPRQAPWQPQPPIQRHHDPRHLAEPPRHRRGLAEAAVSSPEYPPESPRRISYSSHSSNADAAHISPVMSRHSSAGYPGFATRQGYLSESPNDDRNQVDTSREYPGYDPNNPNDVRAIVTDMMRQRLMMEPEYDRVRGGNVPNRFSHIVYLYRIIEGMWTRNVGRTLMLKGGVLHHITREDVVAGLDIRDPAAFIKETDEAIGLLNLYGKDGQREEHPHVMDMLQEKVPVEYNMRAAEHLLRVLREVDAEWNRKHQSGAGNNDPTSSRAS